MGKLRFDINSTDVLGVYGIVDIIFNGTPLQSTKQLSATVESVEYDVDILSSSDNTLKISLLNPQAHDSDGNGSFTDSGDQTLQAEISALSYSIDGTNFVTLLPQAPTSYTVPSGPNVGLSLVLTESVSAFQSFGADYELKFNSDGIVNSAVISGVKGKILPNGNFQDFLAGKTFDVDGNEV